MSPETFEIEILSVETLTPSVKNFLFARVDGRPLAHEPGQWVNFILPTPEGEIRRAYSIASPPDGTPRFEIAVTRVVGGPGSGYLCGLGSGARLRAIGPQGFFTRIPLDPSPTLFVGTGTGVAPLRAMMRAALAAGTPAPLWLLLGVRHTNDLLYRAEFEALARAHADARVFFTLSQGEAEWSGRRGYVQEHIRELWGQLIDLNRGEPHLYVCGLERMITAVRQLVRKEMGVPRERVHSERYD
ncbi:MAG TPA: FAD-dependent oxidoreductase, partial [Polyangiaceae bacterium]